MDIHPWTKYEIARAPRRGAPPTCPLRDAVEGGPRGALEQSADIEIPADKLLARPHPAARKRCSGNRPGSAEAVSA